jgi:hypothetical protein
MLNKKLCNITFIAYYEILSDNIKMHFYNYEVKRNQN